MQVKFMKLSMMRIGMWFRKIYKILGIKQGIMNPMIGLFDLIFDYYYLYTFIESWYMSYILHMIIIYDAQSLGSRILEKIVENIKT